MFKTKLKFKAKISEIYSTRLKLSEALLKYLLTPDEVSPVLEVPSLFRRALVAFPKRCRESDLFRVALYRSLENFTAGKSVRTRTWALGVIAILAGGTQQMLMGRPMYSALNNNIGEFYLAEIVEVRPVDNNCESFVMSALFLTGPLASYTKQHHTTLWGSSQIRVLAKAVGIIPARAPSYQRIHPSHLVGCFVFINMIEEDGYSRMEDIGTSGTLKSRNKKLEDTRSLQELEEFCGSDVDCAFCPCGLSGNIDMQCSRAVRPIAYVLGTCPVDSEPDRLVDPSDPETPSLEHQELMWA